MMEGPIRAAARAGSVRLRRVSGLVLAILLAGCGHATGVLGPVAETVPGASVEDLLVVTTRKPSGDPGTLYSGKRDRTFSLDEIRVSIPPKHKPGAVEWPRSLPSDPGTDFATVSVKPLAPNRRSGSEWLARNLPKSRDVLVFVHGFNNRYEDAVYRFAQIAHDSGADAAPVLFTWPSGGSLFDYNYDRESTVYSRDGLESMLRALSRDPRVHEVSILAHSMGTYLAMEALRQMAIRDGQVAPKIRNVVLSSPSSGAISAKSGRISPCSSPRTTAHLPSRGWSPATSTASARSTPKWNPIAARRKGRASPSST